MDTRGQDEVALAFLATPTDVFAVPGSAVARSVANYADRRTSKVLRVPLRTISGGRLLRRNYVHPPTRAPPGINDSVVLQQGPNYLLAKRLQRWRATAYRADGGLVSLKVAPPTRTRSVVKNRALAAAYAGAHRFGIEVFEPGTANTLMAALLVHDLRTGAPRSPTRGRTRRMPRCTVVCGPRPTTPAAPSASPPCSAWPGPDDHGGWASPWVTTWLRTCLRLLAVRPSAASAAARGRRARSCPRCSPRSPTSTPATSASTSPPAPSTATRSSGWSSSPAAPPWSSSTSPPSSAW